MQRSVIFGASRGLGAELVKHICAAGHSVEGWARKESALKALERPGFQYRLADFSKASDQELAIASVLETRPKRVFCVAAGGPFGPYGERKWSAHEWAWQVSFVFYARLLHSLLSSQKTLPQVILIGSSVAESAADPQAASYCAAKHALRGLFVSLCKEQPQWDLRLFSPGYMDTDMLPAQAAVRLGGVHDPSRVAKDLWTWALTADRGAHRVYPVHPNQESK